MSVRVNGLNQTQVKNTFALPIEAITLLVFGKVLADLRGGRV